MSEATRKMILGWLDMHRGDAEGLARWMRDIARIGSIKSCRAAIAEARGL